MKDNFWKSWIFAGGVLSFLMIIFWLGGGFALVRCQHSGLSGALLASAGYFLPVFSMALAIFILCLLVSWVIRKVRGGD